MTHKVIHVLYTYFTWKLKTAKGIILFEMTLYVLSVALYHTLYQKCIANN